MPQVSVALVTFLRRLCAHVAGGRTYLSFSERERLVAAVAQFDPTYCEARLREDLLLRNLDLLRVALGEVGADGGVNAVYAVVGAIQLTLADARLDEDDLALVHWVGDAVGIERARVEQAIERADGPLRPHGAAHTDSTV